MTQETLKRLKEYVEHEINVLNKRDYSDMLSYRQFAQFLENILEILKESQ